MNFDLHFWLIVSLLKIGLCRPYALWWSKSNGGTAETEYICSYTGDSFFSDLCPSEVGVDGCDAMKDSWWDGLATSGLPDIWLVMGSCWAGHWLGRWVCIKEM